MPKENCSTALRLENKNASITGGASGIGRATAIRSAEKGANIFVADRHLAAAEETAAAVKSSDARRARIRSRPAMRRRERDGRADGQGLGSVKIVVAAAEISHAHYGEEGQARDHVPEYRSFANWRKVLSVNLDACS